MVDDDAVAAVGFGISVSVRLQLPPTMAVVAQEMATAKSLEGRVFETMPE